MPSPRSPLLALAAFALPALFAPAADAAVWSSTNVEYLYGWNYRLTDREAGVMTLEHASGFAYGDNFFFVDITHPVHDETKPEVLYGQWDPRFSLGKIFGTKLGVGPITDLLLTGELGYGAVPAPNVYQREYNYGLGLDIKIPGFAYFAVNFWVHDTPYREGVTYQISPYWGAPFHLGSVGFLFEGFLDYVGEEGEAGKGIGISYAYLITQPRLLIDLGSLWKKEGNLFVGTEVDIWHNKFGADDVDQFTPQAMVKWVF